MARRDEYDSRFDEPASIATRLAQAWVKWGKIAELVPHRPNPDVLRRKVWDATRFTAEAMGRSTHEAVEVALRKIRARAPRAFEDAPRPYDGTDPEADEAEAIRRVRGALARIE